MSTTPLPPPPRGGIPPVPPVPPRPVAPPPPVTVTAPVPPPVPKAPPAAPSRGSRIPSMEELVFRAQDEGVSDIHVGVNERPRFRRRGVMEIIEDLPVTDLETYDRWVAEMLQPEQIEQFRKNMEFDG
ncbi:MAG: hypothetical protein Q6K12_03495, partial [Gloeomargarita sp. DG_1_6_bins_138]